MATSCCGEPVALVTGSSRGLGRGVALQLAGAGCSVAVHYLRARAAAQETVALCREAAAGRRQRFGAIRADIGRAADRARLLAATLERFGRVDALVNNAGVAPRIRADLTETTEESFDELIATNLKGPHFLTQGVVRYWLDEKPKPLLPEGFKVIFVTSISADTASLNRGEYCISKAGLSMVAQLWAARLAPHHIQVFELRPGIMATDMTAPVRHRYSRLIARGLVPQGRWGSAQDVGLAVRAIVAGLLPFSTGAIIPVDGGLHLRRL